MTRSRDTADTQDNNGGAVAPFVAGKNFIINGGFDFFQRGSFSSQTASNYALDRWYSGVGGTVTVTQQSSGAPVGSPNYMRVAYNAASSFANQFQALESSAVQSLVGRTVTATFLVRANAAWTGTGSQGLNFYIEKNVTANTLVTANWNIMGSTAVAANLLPTGTGASDWHRVTVTCSVPNDGTANGVRLRVGESVAGPSGAYWEMAQVQLEVGSVATPFSRAGGTIQGELAACQRYYEKSYNTDVAPGTNTLTGGFEIGGSSNNFADQVITIKFATAKRTAPTMKGWTRGGTANQFNYAKSGASADVAASFIYAGMTQVLAYAPVGANFIVSTLSGHWTAEAEL